MADNITIKDSGGTVIPVATDEVATLNGATVASEQVQRVKVGHGTDGVFNDANAATPLPTGDAAVLAKLSSDPATQTTLAAVLAKLSSDPATQTTLAAVLTALGHLTDGQARVGGTVTTAPTGAGDVAAALTNGRATVTTPGTAVALGTGAIPCKWVTVTARTSNTGQINVGGSGVVAALGSTTGVPLTAGQSVTIPIADAHGVFVDARVAGEGVDYLAGA